MLAAWQARQHEPLPPGERVQIQNTRTGQLRIDYVATANPRFLAFPDGLAFEQPAFVETKDGPVLRPGVPVLSTGLVPRFYVWRAT